SNRLRCPAVAGTGGVLRFNLRAGSQPAAAVPDDRAPAAAWWWHPTAATRARRPGAARATGAQRRRPAVVGSARCPVVVVRGRGVGRPEPLRVGRGSERRLGGAVDWEALPTHGRER